MNREQAAPHIRYPESTRGLMADAILAMLVLYAMAFFYYGPRTALLGAASVGTTVLAEIFCRLLKGGPLNRRDLSPVVTGLLLPLMMPASVPYQVVVAAALFAMLVAKHPFGGTGHNIFNPAAAGFAFVAICYGQQLFRYPQPLQWVPLFPGEDLLLLNAPTFTLQLGGVPKYEFTDMALGNFPGPMGATNILVVFACLLYLVFRGTVRWTSPLAFFATVCAYAAAFPRAQMSPGDSIRYELMSGMLFLGGVFLMGDPVTTPKRSWSKIAHAVATGIVVMLFRRFGNLEESFVFAVLLMNAAVFGFDMLGERVAQVIRGKKIEYRNNPKIQKKA